MQKENRVERNWKRKRNWKRDKQEREIERRVKGNWKRKGRKGNETWIQNEAITSEESQEALR